MVETPSSYDKSDTVQEAHQDWCAEQGIDPGSPLGEEGLQMMVDAFQKGVRRKDDLVSTCDAYLEERGQPVRLGSPPIPTTEG